MAVYELTQVHYTSFQKHAIPVLSFERRVHLNMSEQHATDALQALNKEEGYVLKLLQGYLWYPVEEDIDFGEYLPRELDGEIHLLWDKITPPFTFFDNGTLAATQNVFQFTVVKVNKENVEIEEVGGILPWLADVIQEKLNTTPEGVGWQIMEDLRPI